MARTNHWKNAKATPLLAVGLMACASVLVAQEARADDSLWGKAMNSIGLGGSDQAAPAATPPAAPAAPAVVAPKPASAPKPTAATPKANVQPQQPKQDASTVVHPAAPQANVAPPAAPAEGGNLLTNWFGWGRSGDSASSSGPAPTQKALAPIDVVAPPPPAPPRASEPSMWDKMLGSVGVGNGGVSMDSINYNERQKLAVPKDRVLPQPQPISETPATRAANSDYLIKPPADYMEKAKGADGTVSGLRDVDQPKDKKFFGLF